MGSPKFHINGNGDVKPCKATQRACRYGGEQSHYATEKEAWAAAEASHEKVEILTGISKSLPESSAPLSIAHVKETADALTRELCDESGVFQPPASDSGNVVIRLMDDRFHELEEPFTALIEPFESEKFTKIGSGVERNVYVDDKKDFVYKVPNFRIDPHPYLPRSIKYYDCSINRKEDPPTIRFRYYENYAVTAIIGLQKNYADLDLWELKRKYQARIPITMFMETEDAEGKKIPILVQEYFDPDEWEEYSISVPLESAITNDFPSLYDLHPGNVLKNKHTGELVFIDCVDGYEYF